MQTKQGNKIIVICGQTATGKSSLAVNLAKTLTRHKLGGFNGAEIISADSRQVYKGLDIGTGKITEKEMRGVPHHMLDVADPRRRYSVVRYIVQARRAIENIARRGYLPIICGGTGFYISAIVDGTTFPDVPPNQKLRTRLLKETPETLFDTLLKLDRSRAENIDPKNKRRVIRAIEITLALGKVPNRQLTADKRPPYQTLLIGLTLPPDELKKKIAIRLFARLHPAPPRSAGRGGQARIRKGMIAEAKRLHQEGLSWKRMIELGLEYRYLALYLQKKISKQEMISKLQTEIWRYAKRQMTWLKRDKRIKWFDPSQTQKIETLVKIFLLK